MNSDKEYVRVKLNSSQQNKARGFYLLITHGNTYSDKQFEFIIEKELVGLLTENKIKFERLPLRENDAF